MDRRDFLNSTLLASGSALLRGATPLTLLAESDWTGFGGVGDYARSNGNTYEVATAGHAIRDHLYEGKRPEVTDTGETLRLRHRRRRNQRHVGSAFLHSRASPKTLPDPG
jgi:spermidine dehydrogenase